ncbi:MAG: GHKL domain-containing protein [Defluviitaleaceae bacterium]|nr:GHKL domain-containing protein [Defluviitaleaceae bacterium]
MNLSILSLFTSILTIFAYKNMIEIFFEKRRTNDKVIIFSYILFWAITRIEYFFFTSSFTNTLVPVIGLFLVTLNYKSLLIKKIAAVCCIHLVRITILVVIVHFMYIFPNFFTNEGEVGIISHFVIFIVSLLLRYFKNIKNDSIDLPIVWIPALIFPISLIFGLGFISFNVPHYDMFIEVALFVGVSFTTFYLYDRLSAAYQNKLKSALHAQEKEYYFSQCQVMQESVEQVKSIRHDIKIHLATIKGYSSKINAGEITEYINNLLGDISESEVYSDTGNIAFDSIINFKLKNAKDENIKPDIRLLIPPALNIEVADIVTIIGNLLDNALDAVSKVEDRRIKLDIEYSRESLFIQVENTFDGVVKYDNNTADKRVSTRKSGGEHGHGLKNIRKSVEKYNGHIDITHDENIFTATVLLYVNE